MRLHGAKAPSRQRDERWAVTVALVLLLCLCWHSSESLCLIICPHFIYCKWFANKEMAYLCQLRTLHFGLHVTRDKNKHIFHTIVTFRTILTHAACFSFALRLYRFHVAVLIFYALFSMYKCTISGHFWHDGHAFFYVSISFILNKYSTHSKCCSDGLNQISFNTILFHLRWIFVSIRGYCSRSHVMFMTYLKKLKPNRTDTSTHYHLSAAVGSFWFCI